MSGHVHGANGAFNGHYLPGSSSFQVLPLGPVHSAKTKPSPCLSRHPTHHPTHPHHGHPRARNAAGLRQAAYWKGTLHPRPTVDWYLDRVSHAAEAALRALGGEAPLTLLAHSAGGWLGRVYLGARPPAAHRVDAYVSLGSPQAPPPDGTFDQTRGILRAVEEAYPGAHEPGVAYTTVAGRYACGAPLAGPGGARARLLGLAYAQVCGGGGAVWGDGVVPVQSAHLEGARQLTLDGVYHSPLGAREAAAAAGAAAATAAAGTGVSDLGAVGAGAVGAQSDVAGGPRPAQRRVWYGSPQVLDHWVGGVWGWRGEGAGEA